MIVAALEAGGYTVLAASTKSPFELTVEENGRTQALRIYAWNITSGGRLARPDEFRIQTTQAIQPAPKGLTLILGVAADDGLLVSFDPEYHQEFGASPSVQIQRQDLEHTSARGMYAFARARSDGSQEPVVALTMPLLADHVRSLQTLAEEGMPSYPYVREAALTGELPDAPDQEGQVPPERRRELQQLSRWVRDRRFSYRVRVAYDGRCSFCGVNAGLADGAHIVPVASGGDDEVVNGVAACPTHHRAFDLHILWMDDSYRVHLDERAFESRGGTANDKVALMHNVGEFLRMPDREHLRPSAGRIRDRLAIRKSARSAASLE